MKIVIELSKSEVLGIKDYLKEVEAYPKINKEAITFEIRNIVYNFLHCNGEAVSDYIVKANQKLIAKQIQ